MRKLITPLRYPGGKSKALKKILPLIPDDICEYREPFVGGGSVFVALKQKNPNLFCELNDLNPDVSAFWSCLQHNPTHFITAIREIKKNTKNGKQLYSKLANSRPEGIFGKALRFYILNRITYSGTVDSGGYSSESFYKRFTDSVIEKLEPLSELLKNVEISNESYEHLLVKGGKDVFIFLDPPYWKPRYSPLYGKRGSLNKFFDHEKFAILVEKCKHKWLITCDDSEMIRNLFPSSKFHVFPWELLYNGMHKKKGVKGKELCITNYEIEGIDIDTHFS